jgi:hypothetical protein
MAKKKKDLPKVTRNGHVTEQALQDYLALERKIKHLAAEQREKKAEKEEMEAAFIDAWNRGKRSKDGDNLLTLEVEETTRSAPKWKDEAMAFAAEAGQDLEEYEADVKERYKKEVTKVKVW